MIFIIKCKMSTQEYIVQTSTNIVGSKINFNELNKCIFSIGKAR